MLDLTWTSINRASNHSWERLNHGMRWALELGICHGTSFPGDYQPVQQHYRPGYWINSDTAWSWAVIGGKRGKHVPSRHSLVEAHNMSAVKALEAAGYPCWMLRGFRLFVGAEIYWVDSAGKNAESIRGTGMKWFQSSQSGPQFKVTSITSDRVVLSHYGDSAASRPTSILKITRELLAKQNALFAPPTKSKGKGAHVPG